MANRARAFRINPEDTVYLRLGRGKSIYVELVPSQMGTRIVNLIDYENGNANLIQKVSDHQTTLVGRTSECAIKIINPVVSRRHVELAMDGNVLVVTDLGSSNGTYYHPDCFGFDIDPYLESFPIDQMSDRTMDPIHEAFGPTLDDFLKRYSQKKEAKP